MTAATEPEVRAGAGVAEDRAAIGDAVLERIRTLVGYRRWYRDPRHHGWLISTHTEHMQELRYLLRLRREGRRLFEAAPEQADPMTLALSERDRWITTESELRLMDGNR